MDRGSMVKVLRCRSCGVRHRDEKPDEINVPACSKCGSINTYYSTQWYISYTLKSGEQIFKPAGSNKRTATDALRKVLNEIVEDKYFDKPKILTWEEAAELFKRESLSQMKPVTRKFYEYRLDHYITPFFTGKKLQEITLEDGIKFKEHLDKTKLTDDSKTKAIVTLKKMFNEFYLGRIVTGKGKKYLEHNALAGLKRYPKPASRVVYHTANEVKILTENAPSIRLKAAILLASDAGLRSATIKKLRISHVNWAKNRLEIPPEIRKCGTEVHYKILTKRLREALFDLVEELKTLKTSDLLFASPINPDKPLAKFSEYWRETLAKCGIKGKILLDKHLMTKKKITETQLEEILNNVVHRALKPFILLVVDAKLNINEAKCIKKLQLDVESAIVRCLEVDIPMSARLKSSIIEYLEYTEREIIEDWLLPNRYNHEKGQGSFEQQWRKTLKAAGIKGKRFHDLKHTAGTYMYKITKDIRKVADFLDHADINQSRKYAHVDDEDARRDIEAFESLLL